MWALVAPISYDYDPGHMRVADPYDLYGVNLVEINVTDIDMGGNSENCSETASLELRDAPLVREASFA